MGIKCNAFIQEPIEKTTLAEVREEILAVAKAAKEAGKCAKVEITLPVGTYPITEPFRLSVTDNPELASLSLSIRSEHPGMAKVTSLIRMDGMMHGFALLWQRFSRAGELLDRIGGIVRNW